MTDSTQAVTGTINYDAFGQKAGYTGSSTDPYTYNGQWGYRNDDDDLLAMVGARYYDVTCGRFISRDTRLDELPYSYCNGDPTNLLDPTGHDPAKNMAIANVIWDGLFAGIGGAIGAAGGPVGIIIGGALGGGFGEFLWQYGPDIIRWIIGPPGPPAWTIYYPPPPPDGKYHVPVERKYVSGLQAYYANH